MNDNFFFTFQLLSQKNIKASGNDVLPLTFKKVGCASV
jgi:hypothetical protein